MLHTTNNNLDQKERYNLLHQSIGVKDVDSKNSEILQVRSNAFISSIMRKLIKGCEEVLPSEPTQDEIRDLNLTWKTAENHVEGLQALMRVTRARFDPVCQDLLNSLIPREQANLEELAKGMIDVTERIAEIRPKEIAKTRENMQGEPKDYSALLPLFVLKGIASFGIENAAFTTWSTFEVIPKVFQRDFGRAPSKHEFSEVCNSAREFINGLLNSEDTVFHAILDLVRDDFKSGKTPWRPLIPDYIYIDGKFKLQFKSEVFVLVEKDIKDRLAAGRLYHLDDGSGRSGCPGSQMVAYIYNWCRKAANSFLYEALVEPSSS